MSKQFDLAQLVDTVADLAERVAELEGNGGLLVSSSSGANGSYLRYADGTQICFVSRTVPSTGAREETFYDWPIAFASEPVVATNVRSSVYGPDQSLRTLNVSTTSGTTQYGITSDRTNTTNSILHIVAIGTWS